MSDAGYKWGEDYGKDLLTDLNQLAHAKGTDALHRDGFIRWSCVVTEAQEKSLRFHLSLLCMAAVAGKENDLRKCVEIVVAHVDALILERAAQSPQQGGTANE